MSESQQADYLASIFSPLQLKVYDYLIKEGPTFREAMARKLNTAYSTLYYPLRFLEKLGLAARRVVYHAEHCRGRPVVEWFLPGRD